LTCAPPLLHRLLKTGRMLGKDAKLHRAARGRDLNHLKSTNRSPSAHQVNDQNHQPHNQEQVDQGSADMQTETQKPQNQKNNKNCPKHEGLLLRPTK
jgi:hypothetical protein